MTTATAAKTADHYVVTPVPDGIIISEFDDMSDALEFAVHVGGVARVVFTDGTEQVIA
jgi:hypothetical protein